MELAVLFDTWATAMWRACWQSSLVILAVSLICRLCPAVPARFQSWLWRLAILKFVVALICPALLNLPLLPAPSAATVGHNLSAALHSFVGPLGQTQDSLVPATAISWPHQVVFFTWLMGVAWGVVRLMIAWNEVRQLRKQIRPVADVSVAEQLATQASLFGLRKPPMLRESTCGSGPMLVGMVRSTVVLPAELLRKLTASEQTLVFGHELAHVRRGDLFWSLGAAMVRTVFFFDPLAWLSERQLRLAQESAADELAIAKQKHDPVSYGKLLVSVVGKLGPGRSIPTMSMGTAAAVVSLKRRLIAMGRFDRVSPRVAVGSMILLCTVVVLGLVPWRLVAAEPKAVEKQSDQHLATIKVWESKNGQPKAVLAAPKIVFSAGQEARVELGDKAHARQIQLTVRSSPNEKPIKHLIEARITRDTADKTQVVLTAPKITVTDGNTGRVFIAEADGSELGVEATVSPVTPSATAKSPKDGDKQKRSTSP